MPSKSPHYNTYSRCWRTFDPQMPNLDFRFQPIRRVDSNACPHGAASRFSMSVVLEGSQMIGKTLGHYRTKLGMAAWGSFFAAGNGWIKAAIKFLPAWPRIEATRDSSTRRKRLKRQPSARLHCVRCGRNGRWRSYRHGFVEGQVAEAARETGTAQISHCRNRNSSGGRGADAAHAASSPRYQAGQYISTNESGRKSRLRPGQANAADTVRTDVTQDFQHQTQFGLVVGTSYESRTGGGQGTIIAPTSSVWESSSELTTGQSPLPAQLCRSSTISCILSQ